MKLTRLANCFSIFVFAAQIHAQVLNPGNALVAHYPLDGNTLDRSLNQLHGTILGNPTPVTGQVNLAYQFDGINDVIVVNHDECFNSIDSELTISGWIRPFSIANNGVWLGFLCKGNELGLNSSPFSVLYRESNLTPYIRYTDAQGTFHRHDFLVNFGVELNKWTFFTSTFKKGQSKVYKNGVKIGETTLPMQNFLKTNQPFEIGRDYPGFPEKLDGVLDNICVFNKALSDGQIFEMYQHGHCFTPVPSKQKVTICEGENFNGFTQSGIYNDTILLTNGCHGLTELTLKVLPNSTSSVTSEICEGASFEGYTQTGVYYQNLTAANGCDSVRTINLTVKPPISLFEKITLCPNDTLLLHGIQVFGEGTFFATVSSPQGCDTVFEIKSELAQLSNFQRVVNLCSDEEFEIAGQFYAAPNIVLDTLPSQTNGCDTLRLTELKLLPTPTAERQITLCPGDSIFLAGQFHQPPAIVLDTLEIANGCDTLLIFKLQSAAYVFKNQSFAQCVNEPFWFGGQPVFAPATLLDTLPSATACDTILTIKLLPLPLPVGERTLTLCPGDSIFLAGQFHQPPAIVLDTLEIANGCDTLMIFKLESEPYILKNQSFTLCPDESFSFGGQPVFAPATLRDTLHSMTACDTILNIQLLLSPLPTATRNLKLCPGDSVFLAGKFHHPPAIVLDTLEIANACDTLLVFKLESLPYVFKNQSFALCPGESFSFGGQPVFAPATLRDTLRSTTACDTIRTTQLTLAAFPTSARDTVLCPGESIAIGHTIYREPAVVADTLAASTGCDTLRTTTIRFHEPTPPFLQKDTSICSGEALILLSPFDTTVWNSTFSGKNFTATEPGLYVAEAFDENGCPARDSVLILTCCAESGVYVPNIFSPDDNGLNDEFRAYTTERCRAFTLSVYDRWGELIFRSDDPEKGWNGKFRNRICPAGLYVWVLEFASHSGQNSEVRKGGVTLLR